MCIASCTKFPIENFAKSYSKDGWEKFDGLVLPEYVQAKCAVVETIVDFPSAKKWKNEDEMYQDFIHRRKFGEVTSLDDFT